MSSFYGNLGGGSSSQDSSQTVKSSTIRNIVVLTQDQYDALTTKEANTEYNIIGA